jgi:Ran GTPase-activating protein (RanGAP) involved in mRNA processing and transport
MIYNNKILIFLRKIMELKGILSRLKANDESLKEVDLMGIKIGPKEAKELAQALQGNTTLTELNLSDNQIEAEGVQVIADVLKTNTTLTKLHLWDNQIGDEGAKAIAGALETNTTLTELDLRDNIGNAGAKAIANALETNTTLTRLYLLENQIGNEGVHAIFNALKTNTTLTELYLEDNQIGAEGVQAIADALEKNTNTTLTKLYLVDNIGNAGAQAIADALKTNTTLTELNLMKNQIGDEGAKAIAGALEINKTLTVLGLSDNQIGDEVILKTINTLISRNKNIAKKIATIKTSLLEGAEIVRTKEGQISINDTQYNKDVVELAIKSIAKDLEPNDKDSESVKSNKETKINELKDLKSSSNIYPLVKIINSRDDSGENIFSDCEKKNFIEEFVKSDFIKDLIKKINPFLLSSKQLQQNVTHPSSGKQEQEQLEDAQNNSQNKSPTGLLSLPPEITTHIIYQLLPPRIQQIYENKKIKDQEASGGQEDKSKDLEVQQDKGIGETELVIVSFIKNLFKPEEKTVKGSYNPNPGSTINPVSKAATSLTGGINAGR